MKHTVVVPVLLLTLVTVSRGEAESVSHASGESTATATFATALPEYEGPPPEDAIYEVVCKDASVDLSRQFKFVDMLIDAHERIPESQELWHLEFDCTEVRFILGTIIQVSSGRYFASLYTLSQSVSAADTDEQLSGHVDSMVKKLVAKDAAAKAHQAKFEEAGTKLAAGS